MADFNRLTEFPRFEEDTTDSESSTLRNVANYTFLVASFALPSLACIGLNLYIYLAPDTADRIPRDLAASLYGLVVLDILLALLPGIYRLCYGADGDIAYPRDRFRALLSAGLILCNICAMSLLYKLMLECYQGEDQTKARTSMAFFAVEAVMFLALAFWSVKEEIDAVAKRLGWPGKWLMVRMTLLPLSWIALLVLGLAYECYNGRANEQDHILANAANTAGSPRVIVLHPLMSWPIALLVWLAWPTRICLTIGTIVAQQGKPTMLRRGALIALTPVAVCCVLAAWALYDKLALFYEAGSLIAEIGPKDPSLGWTAIQVVSCLLGYLIIWATISVLYVLVITSVQPEHLQSFERRTLMIETCVLLAWFVGGFVYLIKAFWSARNVNSNIELNEDLITDAASLSASGSSWTDDADMACVFAMALWITTIDLVILQVLSPKRAVHHLQERNTGRKAGRASKCKDMEIGVEVQDDIDEKAPLIEPETGRSYGTWADYADAEIGRR